VSGARGHQDAKIRMKGDRGFEFVKEGKSAGEGRKEVAERSRKNYKNRRKTRMRGKCDESGGPFLEKYSKKNGGGGGVNNSQSQKRGRREVVGGKPSKTRRNGLAKRH